MKKYVKEKPFLEIPRIISWEISRRIAVEIPKPNSCRSSLVKVQRNTCTKLCGNPWRIPRRHYWTNKKPCWSPNWKIMREFSFYKFSCKILITPERAHKIISSGVPGCNLGENFKEVHVFLHSKRILGGIFRRTHDELIK